MQLGKLRASIRAAKGVLPTIEVALYPGAPVIPFALQKASLLEELEKAFPGGKAVETGLTFDEKTGMLSSEFGASAAPVAEPPFDAVQDAIHGPAPTTTVDWVDDLPIDDLDLTGELNPDTPADDDLLV